MNTVAHGQALGAQVSGERFARFRLGGLVAGAGLAWLLGFLVPALPTHITWFYVLVAELIAIAIAIGIVAGAAPAYRAGTLQPVEALRTE